MLVAGAVPTGLAGWWLGARAGRVDAAAAALLVAAASALSLGAAWLAWRWFVSPLRELERGLDRWTKGDLATPLDDSRLKGWSRLGRQFSRAQEDMRRALDEASAGLTRERSRLATLVERIPDALIMTNLRGEVVFVNPPALELLGAGPGDWEPREGRGLLTARDPGKWRFKVQEILKVHSSGGVWEPQGPDGTPKASYRTMVTMFTDPVTGDFGVLLILRDQTAERRLDSLKEEFFQAAAHDLRAPLFAMQGYLRLLRRSIELDDRQKGWLEAIDQSAERMTALVKDALDTARLESGQLKLVPERIDARVLLRRALALFQPLADERGVVLEVRVGEGAPAAFVGDERLIERLLHNLVANAVKFTPKGGRVVAELAAYGADRVELTVTDTGPGVPEPQRAAVFEKFRQLETGQPKSGFGLGLAISAKIVKLHRGEIWVQEGPGGGAQFVVRLPLAQRPKEAVIE